MNLESTTMTAATEVRDIVRPQRIAATYEPVERPSEELFEFLAQHDPSRLLKLIHDRALAPAHMTFAAELAGRCQGFPYAAATVLLPLLDDPSPVVREGAVYGLEMLLHVPDVREALLRRTDPRVEPSPGVRAAAAEALDRA